MRAPDLIAARDTLRASDLRATDPETYRRRMFELSVAAYFRDPGAARDLTPFRVTARTQQAVWDSLGAYDLHPALARLTVTALVLHGHHDPIPLETARRTAHALRAPIVELRNAGHVPHVEAFDDFVAALNPFLPSR